MLSLDCLPIKTYNANILLKLSGCFSATPSNNGLGKDRHFRRKGNDNLFLTLHTAVFNSLVQFFCE